MVFTDSSFWNSGADVCTGDYCNCTSVCDSLVIIVMNYPQLKKIKENISE